MRKSRKKQEAPKKWPSRQAREIGEAALRAGGAVRLTRKGHLRIAGPAGLAFVAGTPSQTRQGGRTRANYTAVVRREAGLPLAAAQEKPVPGRRPGEARARQVTRARAPRRERHGTITRWVPGESYGFITDDDGQSWFLSRNQAPAGDGDLSEGTRVTFSGTARLLPGRPYPDASRVRAVA